MHELGASADTSWLREPLRSDTSCTEASNARSETHDGDSSSNAGTTINYTASLGELRHRLEDLVTAVRRMEEAAEGQDGECQISGSCRPPVEAPRDIELTCGARVRLSACTRTG